ncbi:MAG: hypothetical protein ACRDTJ_11770 [Pseudonocardiaceae bacterium]
MTEEGMDIASGCSRLDRDISTALELSWAIRSHTAVLWSSRSYTPPDPAELAEFDPAELLLVVDKNIKVLDGDTDAEVLLDAADEVATQVVDQLNRPWPEVDHGRVLQIRLVAGDLVWTWHDRTVFRLGDLRTLAAD